MEPAYQLSRRKFLQAALLAAAAGGSGIACSSSSPWRFLRVEEARTLAAASERIIPTDEDPGAAWAGVVNYIDRQLCGPLRDLQDSYRLGIAAMNRSTRLLYHSDFAFLPEAEQVELLTKMEQGQPPRAAWQKISSSEFFSMLVDHTMQGFYGDPRHGGNRGRASWQMVGLSYPPIRGRQKYDLRKS
ncbi:MAG TPA: gluconate 2-dehydrogenase subunit 3 family protein [Terriglobales bacterium]